MVDRAATKNTLKLRNAVKNCKTTMDGVFKIEQVEGKNLGCIALTDIKKGKVSLVRLAIMVYPETTVFP